MNWSAISPRFQSAGRYAAIALGASIPISVALDNVLFLLVLLAWLAGGGLRQKLAALRANPAALAALAFFALIVLGMTWSPPGSWREGWYYVSKYKDLVLVAALAGLVAGARDKRLALTAFLAAMTLTLVLSYALWLDLLPVRLPNRIPENPFVFKLQITHGVLMALAAFLAAARALRATQRLWRFIYTAGASLAAFNVLFMVEGRTGYLVLGVLALYLGIAHGRWRGGLVAAAAIAATLGAAQLANAPMFGRVTLIETELQEWDAGRAGETSTGLRMNYYKITASIVRDHPILGVGTGGFISAYREKMRGTALPESNNPHNQYLLTAAQLGALGVLALLAMFLVMWWQAGRLEADTRLAACGLVLTIAAGCLLNSFLIDHVEGLLFAWMAGVLFAAPGRTA